MAAFVLAVHGGAGRIPRRDADPAYARAARAGLAAALDAGGRLLAEGGDALAAVVAAVEALEDCEVLNAGRGSVLSAAGEVEMDAAVMRGHDRRAGGVAGLRGVAHPVRAALAVLEASPHVLLAGAGAEAFARAQGLATADPAELVAISRRETGRRRRAAGGDETPAPERPGTVGAVALGPDGLAAATSTGGTAGKHPGRVSDSCLPGAGTWADDATCAVSATGLGESFVRSAFAHEVDALLRHAGLDLDAACAHALGDVQALGGHGGCIAVDRGGRVAFRFDTPGMPRGLLRAGDPPLLAICPGDDLAP